MRRGSKEGGRSAGWVLAGLFAVAVGCGCDVQAIEQCHELMKSSQKVMLDMDTNELVDVERALAAVDSALIACRKAGRADEVTKVEDAHRKLTAQMKGLKKQAERKERPKLSDAEMAVLKKSGDPTCPKGQQYEHHQNKALIDCAGPQLVEMNWAQASEYFDRRGYAEHPSGSVLSLEKGVERYDFRYAAPNSAAPPECLGIVAGPGVSWQETVTRATSVHPRKLSLGKPVKTKNASLELLVEGSDEQYTVKLGKCRATPGQSPVKAPE
jgi:hypothetical protein